MNREGITDELIREFVLGKLEGAERDQVESLFLTDADVREQVMVVEQELIEDYLEDGLNVEDKERFLARFAQTEEQRQKLRITKAIIDRASATSLTHAAPASGSLWSRLSKSYFKPVLLVPIAVVIVVAVVLAIVWRNGSEEKREILAIEQELAQLNSPVSLSETPEQLVTLDLRPVAVRSVEPQAEVSPESPLVELRLSWIQSEMAANYRAEIRRVGSNEVYSVLVQSDSVSNRTIRLRLPSRMLARGNYIVRLTSVASDGTIGFSEEYNFAVRP